MLIPVACVRRMSTWSHQVSRTEMFEHVVLVCLIVVALNVPSLPTTRNAMNSLCVPHPYRGLPYAARELLRSILDHFLHLHQGKHEQQT